MISAVFALANLLWTYYVIKVYCPELSAIDVKFRKRKLLEEQQENISSDIELEEKSTDDNNDEKIEDSIEKD